MTSKLNPNRSSNILRCGDREARTIFTNHDRAADGSCHRGAPHILRARMRPRMWGPPPCQLPSARSQFRKPDLDLPLRGLRRIGAVDKIEGDLGAKLTANRAGLGLHRIGGANDLASSLDRVGAL